MIGTDSIFGYKEYRLTGENVERFFGKVTSASIHIHAIRPIPDGITFRAWLFAENNLKKIAEELSLSLEKVSSGGLPLFLSKYKNRYGLFAGAFLAAAFLIITSFFIFDITVEGNVLIYEEDILALLEENGLYKGARASTIDCEELKLLLMENFETIAYAYVNVKGSRAEVKITEKELPPKVAENSPCNIVASESGQIVRFETYKGTACSEKGKGVEAGQLLVSGVIDSKRIGYRTVHASALVMARTKQTIEIMQDFSTCVSYLTGNEDIIYTVDILGLKIALGKEEIPFDDFHEEKETIHLILQNGRVLPISLTKAVRYELKNEDKILSEEEATAILEAQLSERERIAFSGLEVEDKETKFTLTDRGITLTATYTVIKNIAEEREIYLSLPG